jgi:hypothetical protein
MSSARMTVATLALLFAGSISTALAEGDKDNAVIQKIGHGEINWSAKTVTATGSGAANLKDGPVAVARLNAERAAKLDALRNILETLQGVQVDGSRNLGDMMSNGTIRAKVQGKAKRFKIVDQRYYSDGSVDVVVQMPLDEELTTAVNSRSKKRSKLNTSGPETITGLIVNARGLGLVPSIVPRIVDEKGKEVYGGSVVSNDGMKQGGIATYVQNEGQAKEEKLVGKSPLVLKALRLNKKSKTDIVITNADAAKLKNKSTNQSFLANGKVVIVTD